MNKHLGYIVGTRRTIELATKDLAFQVAAARKAGASWGDVGKALGITRQAAWERFATHPERESGYREVPGQTSIDHD